MHGKRDRKTVEGDRMTYILVLCLIGLLVCIWFLQIQIEILWLNQVEDADKALRRLRPKFLRRFYKWFFLTHRVDQQK